MHSGEISIQSLERGTCVPPSILDLISQSMGSSLLLMAGFPLSLAGKCPAAVRTTASPLTTSSSAWELQGAVQGGRTGSKGGAEEKEEGRKAASHL